MKIFLQSLWRDENAISSVEYALLLGLIAAGVIFAAGELSDSITAALCNAATTLGGGAGCV